MAKFFQFKAIETHYKGYHFRSRIEARWAVFFDALGISWEYEKEGYELGDTRYLPDFWMPDMDSWIEIKGQKPTEEEIQKAKDLSLYTKKVVFVISGNIGFHGENKLHFIQMINPPTFEEYSPPVNGKREVFDVETSAEIMAIIQKLREANLYTILDKKLGVRISDVEGIWIGASDYSFCLKNLKKQHEVLSAILPIINEYQDALEEALTPQHGGSVSFDEQTITDDLDWVECESCGGIAISIEDCDHYGCSEENNRQNMNTPRLMAAYEAARSARFEKGR